MTWRYNLKAPNTRRGPVTSRQPGREPVLSARPTTFVCQWAWLVAQAEVARDDPPIRIHDEDRPVDGHVKRQPIIMGWPFSLAFERYTSGKRSAGPIAQMMADLRSPRGNHPHEYRILFALLNGHTDPEIVRALVGNCRRDFFESAAVRAFELVWTNAKESIEGVMHGESL